MTPATQRTIDPPSGWLRERESAEAGESPAQARLLTMRSVAHMHSELLAQLSSSCFELRPLAHWEQLLDECGRLDGGVVLLDLDEAERSPSLREMRLSAHRLVRLVARELKDKAVALALLTTRDYAEIEDLMRAGVHALLHPHTDVQWRVEQVRMAVAQRRAQHMRRRAVREERRDSVALVRQPQPERVAEAVVVETPVVSHPAPAPIVALHP